jgi:hypothetical protein
MGPHSWPHGIIIEVFVAGRAQRGVVNKFGNFALPTSDGSLIAPAAWQLFTAMHCPMPY